MDAPLFDLNYGLPDLQLKLEIPVEIVHEDSNGTVAGAGAFSTARSRSFSLGYIRRCWCQREIMRVDSVKAKPHLCCRFSRKKIERSGLYTATSGIGGKARTKRATTSTRVQCSNVKSANNLS